MTVTALQFAPDLAAVGQTVTVVPVGTVPANTDLRFYLLSAPPSSSLDTLATYEADGKTLADIRLKVKANGQATFTPDVPGQYTVVVRPVTTYEFVPSFGGAVPASGEPAKADNEEGPFTVGLVETPQVSDVPSFGAALWVYETLTRTIGFTQDTATLSVKVYNNRVVDHVTVTDPVTLTVGPTPPSKAAAYAPDVEAVLDHIRAITSSGNRELAYHATVLSGLVTSWNKHIVLDTYKVHTSVADVATDQLTSTANVSASLSSIGTRLDDIVAKFNAHRVRLTDPTTLATLHAAADNTNVMTAGSVTTLTDAIAYYEHVHTTMQAHATRSSFHHSPSTGYTADGYFGWLAESPRSLSELADAINGATGTRWENYGLTSLYENHRIRSDVAVHPSSAGLGQDSTNTVYYLAATPVELYATANVLADAITRHVKNLDSDGAAAGTPYHFTDASLSRLPTRRASDARSFALTVEELWLCLESHLWSAGPVSGYVTDSSAGTRGMHGDRVFGVAAINGAPSGSPRPMAAIRLAKAFDAALSDATVTTEASLLGYLATQMRLFGGFT